MEPARSCIPKTAATACGTSAASCSLSNSTSHTPSAKTCRSPGRGPQRETGLPDPADARQGQQARAGKQHVHLSQVRVTTNEAGELGGKVPPCDSGLRHHRTTLRQTPPLAQLARRFQRESLEGVLNSWKVLLNSKDVGYRGPCPRQIRSTFQESKRRGFYPCPALDMAGSNVVWQAPVGCC